MRKVAGYFMNVRCKDEPTALRCLSETISVAEAWLDSKGNRDSTETAEGITFEDGRVAKLEKSEVEASGGRLWQIVLTEPAQTEIFVTTLSIGRFGHNVLVYIDLHVGTKVVQLQPLTFDVRCPRIVRDIIALDFEWNVGEIPLRCEPLTLQGSAGGYTLSKIIWHPQRNLPIVVVSEYEGSPIARELDSKIAADLAGLAITVRIDEAAAWTLTQEKGKEWSCYNGALRVYWPLKKSLILPFAHPLWTAQRLLAGSANREDASFRIRRQLRTKILGLSAFSVSEPEAFIDLRSTARKEEAERLRNSASTNEDWQSLAEDYAASNDQLVAENKGQRQLIKDLQDQIQNLSDALSWAADENDITPDVVTPPTTITDAVNAAKERFGANLLFGDDVEAGVRGLAADAGPPEKILDHLESLSELGGELAQGTLGKNMVAWLKDRGVNASIESKTVQNSRTEIEKRSWRIGGSKRQFSLHLKPSDATSPDRCVRIYFDYDKECGMVLVGWIGRHP